MCGCHSQQSVTSKEGCPRLTPCARVDSGGLSSTTSYNGPHPCPLPHSQSLWVTRQFFLKTNYYYPSEHPWASGGEDDISCYSWKQCHGKGEAVLSLAMKWQLKNQRRRHQIQTQEMGPAESNGDTIPPHKHRMKENYWNNTVMSSMDMREEGSLIAIMHWNGKKKWSRMQAMKGWGPKGGWHKETFSLDGGGRGAN